LFLFSATQQGTSSIMTVYWQDSDTKEHLNLTFNLFFILVSLPVIIVLCC
jgi:hypothetical protein